MNIPVNRYTCLEKQDTYIAVTFPYNSNKLIGKTKKQIRILFGEPKRVLSNFKENLSKESWVYYPKDTNNFIAIIVTFEGNEAKECSYQSVI